MRINIADLVKNDPDNVIDILRNVPSEEVSKNLGDTLDYLKDETISKSPFEISNGLFAIQILFGNCKDAKSSGTELLAKYISRELAERTLNYIIDTASSSDTELQWIAARVGISVVYYPFSQELTAIARKAFEKVSKESPDEYARGHAETIVQIIDKK